MKQNKLSQLEEMIEMEAQKRFDDLLRAGKLKRKEE